MNRTVANSANFKALNAFINACFFYDPVISIFTIYRFTNREGNKRYCISVFFTPRLHTVMPRHRLKHYSSHSPFPIPDSP